MVLSLRDHQLLRAAIQLNECYQTDQVAPQTSSCLPNDRWAQILKLERQLQKAHQHGYTGASRICIHRFSEKLRLLVSELATFEIQSKPSLPSKTAKPSLRDLYEELRSLADEFVIVDVDLSPKEIVVQTEQIVLDGLMLGRFEIRLSIPNVKEVHPFRIVALDPNSPVSDDNVTHPHVQSESLCAGEGSQAISSALAEGRLSDFFLTVHQILQTYNPASAYVALDEWQGTTCDDCGVLVDSDETSCCEQCGSHQCDRCTSTCQDCEVSLCASCAESCVECGQSSCRNCLNCCQACEDSFCRFCIEENRCQSCHDHLEESENAEPENPSTHTKKPSQDTPEANKTAASSYDSLQPVCVGEATVSA